MGPGITKRKSRPLWVSCTEKPMRVACAVAMHRCATPSASNISANCTPVLPPPSQRACTDPPKRCTTRATLMPPPPGWYSGAVQRNLCVSITCAVVVSTSTLGLRVKVVMCAISSIMPEMHKRTAMLIHQFAISP